MRRLTILRPEPGASASLALARELGIEASAMPLFKVEPLPWKAPEAAGFDALLLTSANALRHGGPQLKELRRLKVYAVGDATAEAARQAGFDIASIGSMGVERLLGSIATGQRLLHLCGEDRVEPGDTRHQIVALPVYRAAELPPPDHLKEADVVAVHSPRAARRFAELALDRGLDRSAISIAAISRATADAAGGDWQEVRVARKPDDRYLLALAKELCNKPQ
jgi:uroporphyrinogen-III synthase